MLRTTARSNTSHHKLLLSFAVAALTVVGVAGCTSTPSSSGSGAASGSESSSSAAASGSGGSTSGAAVGSLATETSSLGKIVVNGSNMAVYVFDKDTANSGTSACTGECLTAWPPVTTTSATPKVTDVTGTVGTITDPDGKLQVTIDGLPLYTYSGDAAKGDVKGQGLMGSWWVVSPDGKKVTTSASGY